MKKKSKRILLIIGILVLVLIAIPTGFYIKMKSELKEMSIIETKQIVENIYSVHDSMVNLYLIRDSSQYIAIDAGNDAEVVLGELKKLNIEPDKIIAIFLTHTDGDQLLQ